MARSIKLRGSWVDVDPQGWRDRTDMTINVGLGFHTKNQLLGMLVQLLSMQKEAAAAGLADPKKMYHTLEKIINAGGVGDVRQFFIDPGTPEEPNPEYTPPQPQPDANMILAQAQAKALEQEQQRKAQEVQIKAQFDGQKLQLDTQLKQAELQGKQLDRELKARELAIKEREMMLAGDLKQGELDELTAKVGNIDEDTRLKAAQANLADMKAATEAVEASETYQQAKDIVDSDGEVNEGHNSELERQDNAEESSDGEESE